MRYACFHSFYFIHQMLCGYVLKDMFYIDWIVSIGKVMWRTPVQKTRKINKAILIFSEAKYKCRKCNFDVVFHSF